MTSESPAGVGTTVVSVDQAAEELYAYPPHAFASRRAQYAEQARAAGAADVAARIERLRVPSAAAWLSNQLVRYFRDQVLTLLDLGRALQVATDTLDADALHLLGDRRRDLCGELFQRAAWLAVEERVSAGRPVLRGLGDTLHSAMCSEQLACEMLTGRLVRSLPRISWPGLTPDSFPDELGRRRARRVAQGLAERRSRYATAEDDGVEQDDAPLATVTSLRTVTRIGRRDGRD